MKMVECLLEQTKHNIRMNREDVEYWNTYVGFLNIQKEIKKIKDKEELEKINIDFTQIRINIKEIKEQIMLLETGVEELHSEIGKQLWEVINNE